MRRDELRRWLQERERPLVMDGAMGSLLGERGWEPPELPEEVHMRNPEILEAIHEEYCSAGADILETNSFGGSPLKLDCRGLGEKAFEINARAAAIAKKAARGRALVAGSVGPLGESLAPLGHLSFNDARSAFREQIRGLLAGGADFILIETMLDMKEAKAAVLGLKDCDPQGAFVVSFTFDTREATVTGVTPEAAAVWAESMGAVAVGANCGVGPEAYLPVVRRLGSVTALPIFVYANAGLPGAPDYCTPETFARLGRKLAQSGAAVVGGCCGTNPEYIRLLREALEGEPLLPRDEPRETFLCSPSRVVRCGNGEPLRIIGERINVSRKSPLRDEVACYEYRMVREEARLQTAAGAALLDVNVGLPQIDRCRAMREAVEAVERASELPLSLDSDDAEVLRAGLEACTGSVLLNSVTASEESLTAGIELAQFYGASLVVLSLNDQGIAETAEGRLRVGEEIARIADRLGFPRKRLFVDALAMAVGADAEAPAVTLRVVRGLKEMGFCTVLGISNVSHGMPVRPLLNRTYLAMAIAAGLDAVIADPRDVFLMDTVAAANALCGRTEGGKAYIERAPLLKNRYAPGGSSSGGEKPSPPSSGEGETAPSPENPPEKLFSLTGLQENILLGEEALALKIGEALFEEAQHPLEIVNLGVIPALDRVGRLYEEGSFFLPQLVAAAGAAQKVCRMVVERLGASGENAYRGTILMATVKGDLHDLGKNIVGTVLGSHGYRVVDLGKDVSRESILEAVRSESPQVLGLSALMTSTMKEMEAAVAAVRQGAPEVKIMVGGASVNATFAERIGAHGYSEDAVSAVRLVEALLSGDKG